MAKCKTKRVKDIEEVNRLLKNGWQVVRHNKNSITMEKVISKNKKISTKMVDNFDEILDFIQFKDKNSFYYVSVIKRKKDNPDMLKQEVIIDQYYYSRKEFEKMRDRIIESCHLHNARLYLRINMRDSVRIAYKLVEKIGEMMGNNNFNAIANAYDSMVGKYHHDPIKKFMIDVDSITELVEIKDIIARNKGAILLELTTKNGVHLVTNGFDVREMNQRFPKTLSKNGSVLMYCP